MPRVFQICLPILLSLSACYHMDNQETVDEDGVRTEFNVESTTGLKQGPLRQFAPDGTLLLEEEYQDDKLNGERKLYYPDGTLEVHEHYVDGRFEGEYTNYYPNGKPNQIGQFVDGASNGVWFKYNDDGTLFEEVTFVDNLENGPFREWYPNGQPKASGNYLGGDKEHDILHLYLETGELKKVMNCVSGRCATIWAPDSTGVAPVGVDMSLPSI